MPASVYVKFRTGSIPTLDEGVVYPLLKRNTDDPVDTEEYVWAFAISRLPDNKNRLLSALLQAAGFEWDANSANSTTHDFYLAFEPLIVRKICSLEFTPATFPDPTFGADLVVLDPKGGGSLNLAGAAAPIPGNDRPFGISYFRFVAGSIQFRLGQSGTETNPSFQLQLEANGTFTEGKPAPGHAQLNWLDVAGLPGNVALQIPNNVAHQFEIKMAPAFGGDETDGQIQVNGIGTNAAATALPVIPNNTDFDANGDRTPEDTRHTRVSLDHGAFSYHEDTDTPLPADPRGNLLAIELFAAVRFEPYRGLLLSLTVASDVLSASFRRTDPVHGELILKPPLATRTTHGSEFASGSVGALLVRWRVRR